MIILSPLDNVFPPVWPPTADHAVTPDAGLTSDVQTSVRWHLGEHPLNYFNFQRTDGDLFKRDLILRKIIQDVIDLISTRTGITFNLPATKIWPANYVVMGRFKLNVAQAPRAFLVATDVKVIGGGAQTDQLAVTIRNVTDGTDTLVVGAAARRTTETTKYFAALLTTDRATAVPADKEFEVRVSNASGSPIIGTGTFIWQPSLHT